jgi:DtxR family transcriptional regulator, Mn-dependent transcriptional regulator
MSHVHELADQDLEEVAEELFTLGEDGRDSLDDLRLTSQVAALDATLQALQSRRLAHVLGGRVTLTPAGRALAERQVRRHRLAESLFTTVLEVKDDDAVNRTACVMEHVLDSALTDSICAFLGHPPLCPHGKPIPPGPCCRSAEHLVEPAVQPLDRLPIGRSGRIAYIVPRQPEQLVKLSSLGIVPGAIVALQQTRPAAVVRVGETTLALDASIAASIYVKRAPSNAAEP